MEKTQKETINEFIENWSKEPLKEGKNFEELLTIDGFPLWWFYHRMFVEHVMPKPLNFFSRMYQGKKMKIFDLVRSSCSSLALQKILFHKELLRMKKHLPVKSVNESTKNEVVFLSYTNHLGKKGVFRIQKIFDLIKKDQRLSAEIYFSEPFISFGKSPKVPKIYRYFDKKIEIKSRDIADNLFGKWMDVKPFVKDYLNRNHEGIKYWPFLKGGFSFFFSKEVLTLLAIYYLCSIELLQREKTKVVVLTATNGLVEKCLQAAAYKMKIPVVVIQHGIGGLTFNPRLLSNTSVALFSEDYIPSFVSQGVKRENIIPVGGVIFDDIVRYKNFAKDSNKVVMATSCFVEVNLLQKAEYFKRIRKIISEINALPGFELSIKLHPREVHIKEYQKIISEINPKISIISNNDRDEFYKELAQSSVFVHFYSTTVLEAMILDKPCMSIDIGANPNASLTEESGSSIEVKWDEDIAGSIQEALQTDKSKERAMFIDKVCGKVDGKAYERVVKLIYSLSES